MRAVLIDQRRGALVLEVVGASAEQAVALRREVVHRRRDIDVPREPGLHGVPIRRFHIDEMRGQERADVRIDEIVEQRRARAT